MMFLVLSDDCMLDRAALKRTGIFGTVLIKTNKRKFSGDSLTLYCMDNFHYLEYAIGMVWYS